MCEGLQFLIVSFGEILKSAVGIALGTTLATVLVWTFLIGPILRDNERRKRDEEILTELLGLVQAIESLFDEMLQQEYSKAWAQNTLEKVIELDTYVKQTMKATMPDLATVLVPTVNEVFINTKPLNKFLKPGVEDKEVVEWVKESVREIEVLRNNCENLTRIVHASRHKDIQRLLPQEITDRLKAARRRIRRRYAEKER